MPPPIGPPQDDEPSRRPAADPTLGAARAAAGGPPPSTAGHAAPAGAPAAPGDAAPGDAAPGDAAPGDAARRLLTAASPDPPPDGRGWLVRTTRYLFRSRWYALRQDDLLLHASHALTYTYVEHPGYAMVVPVFDDRTVLMERLWRHTLKAPTLSCPSGGLDGEPPEVAARRELAEETGHRAASLAPLGSFFGSSGISSERFHLFLASGLSPDAPLAREPAEDMDLVRLPLADLREAALAGGLPDAPSALAILLAWEHLAAGERRGGTP